MTSEFYEKVYFTKNIQKEHEFTFTQGDTQSRGLEIEVLEGKRKVGLASYELAGYFLDVKQVPYEIEAEKKEDVFYLEFPKGLFDHAGTVEGELILKNVTGFHLAMNPMKINLKESIRFKGENQEVKLDWTVEDVRKVKVNEAKNADTVGGYTVGVDVPKDANFNDTVYNDSALRKKYNKEVLLLKEGKLDNEVFQERWQQLIDEMTDKDVISAPEIIAARNGEVNLKTRLDKEQQEVTAQLAQTTYDVSELQAYVGYTDHDIVGIEADLQNRRITRIAGAVNRTAGASFDNIRAFGGRRRCTVADDGEVLGYHGESSYDETGATGQVMVEQPKFYYKVVPLKLDKIEDGKGFHMRKARYYVSDSPKEGFKIHPAFVDKNGKIRDFIYLSAFEGSVYDVTAEAYLKNDEQTVDFASDLLSSIPGSKPASGLRQRLTRGNTRKLAQSRGAGWEQAYSATTSLTQLLFAIEYASFNTQEALAYGVLDKPSGGGNESEVTGATTPLGNESGFVKQNGFDVPSYRGEENFYGNIWKWVDGLNIKPKEIHDLYVATHSFTDDSGVEPYKNAGFTLAKNTGYVSAFGYSDDFDWIFFPSETDGNTSVPVGDYFYQDNESTAEWLKAVLGGAWDSGSAGGGFYWYVNISSGNFIRARGGRLVYAPKGGN